MTVRAEVFHDHRQSKPSAFGYLVAEAAPILVAHDHSAARSIKPNLSEAGREPVRVARHTTSEELSYLLNRVASTSMSPS